MERAIEGKLLHDITGHYNRFDIFQLKVKPAAQPMISVAGEGAPVTAAGALPPPEER
jgi:aliphatic nitrilase